MAATALAAVDIPVNGSADVTPAQAIDAITGAGNGVKIKYPKDGALAIIISNSAVADKVVTVKAGDYQSKNQGDLSVTVKAGKTNILGWLESARFKKSDGYLYIEFAAAMTGFISVANLRP